MKRDLTIWVISYSYTDLNRENAGRRPIFHKDAFIGTIKDWKCFVEGTRDLWGSDYTDVKKRHATHDEIVRYKDSMEDEVSF